MAYRPFEFHGEPLVETENGHWLLRKKDTRGRPTRTVRETYNTGRGRLLRVHREIFEKHYELILNTRAIQRDCDHPGCVRPEHWTIKHTLSEEEEKEIVERIRKGESQLAIAIEYGIARGTVHRLARKIRKEAALGRNEKTKKVAWQNERNPFWVEVLRLRRQLAAEEKKRRARFEAAEDRGRKNERSSASTLMQEVREIEHEIRDLQRQIRRFSQKASTYWLLIRQAEELRSTRKAKAEAHAKAHRKPQSGEADDESDAGSRTR